MTKIAQKSCISLFPLWYHRKNHMLTMKKSTHKEQTYKALKKALIFKLKKIKLKSIFILLCTNFKLLFFEHNYKYLLQCNLISKGSIS